MFTSLINRFKTWHALYKELFVRPPADDIDLEYMTELEAAYYRQGTPWAYRLSIGLLIFFLLFLFWSCMTTRDEVIRGTGHIALSRGVQPIQSPDGGIITDVFVRENQEVEKGQVLARLSNILAIAEYHELMNRQVEDTLALIRLKAEDEGTPLVFSEDLVQEHPSVVRDQMRLYETRAMQYESEGRELSAQLVQKRLEAEEAERKRKQFEKSLLLLKQQEERVKPLVGRSYSEIDYLNLRQRIVSQEGELNGLAQVISRTQSVVREAEERLKNREPERKAKIADEMNKFRQDLAAATEALAARSDKVSRTDLRAPMRGVVKRIILKQDSVARQAETIMEVLPLDDSLEIVARFHPRDRGFIRHGQEAIIKISAYDYSVYGGLDAEITYISSDTIEDSKGQPWYEVRLRTERSTLPKKEDLEMKVGMTVQVDVLSGEKSIMAYLMKPLIRSKLRQNVIGRDISENRGIPAGTPKSSNSTVQSDDANTAQEGEGSPAANDTETK